MILILAHSWRSQLLDQTVLLDSAFDTKHNFVCISKASFLMSHMYTPAAFFSCFGRLNSEYDAAP